MPDTDIISQIQSLERKGDAVEVDVAVTGPTKLETTMKQRARGRALAAAGVLPTTYSTIRDIPMGEIQRFTEVTDTKPGDDVTIDSVPVLGKLLQTKVFTVKVNRD